MAKAIKVSSAQRKHALERITRIAKEFETHIESYEDWQSAVEVIREVITRNIGDGEFLAFYDLSSLALVHSNRLREGICFNHGVGLNAARSTVPIAQVYHRDTGETLLDAACPIYFRGKQLSILELESPFRQVHCLGKFYWGSCPLLY